MLAVLSTTAACTDDTGDVPDPDTILSEAAAEMAQVRTVRLQVEAGGEVAQLPVRSVDVRVTRDGDAEGTAALWIGADQRELHRARFDLPDAEATVTLSDRNAPVEIRAPVVGMSQAEYARASQAYQEAVAAALRTEYSEIFAITAGFCLLGALVSLALPGRRATSPTLPRPRL